jgi:ABC-type uncharacterized transport system permease subunit
MAIYVIRTWLQWLTAFVAAVAGERLLLGMTWSFFAAGVVTSIAFAVLTAMLFADWRATRTRCRCRHCYR